MIAFLLSSNMTILRSCQFPKQSQLDMLDPLADNIREGGPSCVNVFQAVAAHNVNGALRKTFSLAACRREHPSPGRHASVAGVAVHLCAFVSIQPVVRISGTWVLAESDPNRTSSSRLFT